MPHFHYNATFCANFKTSGVIYFTPVLKNINHETNFIVRVYPTCPLEMKHFFNRGEITPTCGEIKVPCESSGKIYGGEINVHHKQLYISKLLCYT